MTPEVGSKDFVLVNMLCRGKTVCLKPNIVKVILVDWLFFSEKHWEYMNIFKYFINRKV